MTQDKCPGPRILVQINNPDVGWESLFWDDEDRTHPSVFCCKGSATKEIQKLTIRLLIAVVNGQLDRDDLPNPEDLRIVNVDEEPTDTEVVDTTVAAEVLRSIFSKES